VYSLVLRQSFRYRDIINFTIFILTAAIVSLPQLLLTYQLTGLSSRHEASLGFALWGSFSPLNMMSICFPYPVFHGTRFYIGILSIVFFAVALSDLKSDKKIRPLFVMLIVSIFLALGLYNPVYIFLLKITHLYFFRNPSKFIFFGVFAASILTGIGFSRFFAAGYEMMRIKAARMCAVFFIIMISTFFIARAAMIFFADNIVGIGKWFVLHYIAGKPYHRYGVSTYLNGVEKFYGQLVAKSSVSNIFVLSSLILCVLILAICVYLTMMKKRRLGLPSKFLATVVIFADLYVFSFYGTGFMGNIKPFGFLKPAHDIITQRILSDKGLFRIAPFGLTGEGDDIWFMPNANILNGMDSIAAYSPLIESRYKDALQELQVVDDSSGVQPPSSSDVIIQKYQFLRLLNVKYIISKQQLNMDFLKKITSDNGLFLYEMKNYLPRLFFTRNIEGDILSEFEEKFFITEYRSGMAEAYVDIPCSGYLVFSENYYPGWRAYIDGHETEIIDLKGMVQVVKVTGGNHNITFRFYP